MSARVLLENVTVEANLDPGYASMSLEGDQGHFHIRAGQSTNVTSGFVRRVTLYKDDGGRHFAQVAHKGKNPFFEGGSVNASGPGQYNTVTFEEA